MARRKAPKPARYRLKIQPFNPDRPEKFGMRVAMPLFLKPRVKRRKGEPEKLTFSAGSEHTYLRKAIPSTILADPLFRY